jgi:hypothetical protein
MPRPESMSSSNQWQEYGQSQSKNSSAESQNTYNQQNGTQMESLNFFKNISNSDYLRFAT